MIAVSHHAIVQFQRRIDPLVPRQRIIAELSHVTAHGPIDLGARQTYIRCCWNEIPYIAVLRGFTITTVLHEGVV